MIRTSLFAARGRASWHSAAGRIAIGALGAILALSLSPSFAYADQPSDLQAQLSSATDQLDSLNQEAASLDEQINGTQTQLDQVNADIEQERADLAAARAVVAKRVSTEYKTGNVTGIAALLNLDSFNEFVARVYYADKVSSEDAQAIQQVEDIQSDLEAKQSQYEDLRAQQAAQKDELDSKIQSAQEYKDSLSAEVQQALAEQQAAADAASKAQAEATQSAAVQAAQAADVASTSSSSDTGSGSSGGSSSSSSGSGSGTTYSGSRAAVVSEAYSLLGIQYSELDCSGLVQECYAAAGISLEHYSGSIGASGVAISLSEARPGDVIYWDYGHVAIYVGDGQMIEATVMGSVSHITNVRGDYTSVRRIIS